MKVDKDLIKKVGEVSRLSLSNKEVDKFVFDFKEILGMFSKLDEVNVNKVEPSFQPIKVKDKLREDEVEESFSQDEALDGGKDGYFKGPKVV